MVSSLSFAAGAFALARRRGASRRATLSDRLIVAALAANGLGSFWYHGHDVRSSRWAHDWAISALAWGLAVRNAGPSVRLRLHLTGLTSAGLVHAVVPSAAPLVHGAAATALGMSAMVPRRGGPFGPRAGWHTTSRRLPSGRNATTRIAGCAFIAAVSAYLVGRTGSRFCRPDSLWQPHAAWHVLAAFASTALALDTVDRRR